MTVHCHLQWVVLTRRGAKSRHNWPVTEAFDPKTTKSSRHTNDDLLCIFEEFILVLNYIVAKGIKCLIVATGLVQDGCFV